MLIFGSICIAGFLILLGGSLLGHDHDHDHSFDHGDHSHDGDHGDEPAVSIFSPKVIGTFIMSFGAGGFVAKTQGASQMTASFWGLVTGVLLSVVMYLVLRLIYSQQSSSLVSIDGLVGLKALVTVSVGVNSTGQVGLTYRGQYRTYLARSEGDELPKGQSVEIVSIDGGILSVR